MDRRKRKIINFILFFLGLSILLLYLFHVGLYEIVSTILKVDFRYLTLAIALRWVASIFFVGTWSLLILGMNENVKFSQLFRFSLISNVINFFIPSAGFGGEVAKAYFVKKETDIPFFKSFASVELHRFILFFPFLMGTAISLFSLIFIYELPRWVILGVTFILAVTTAGIGLTFFLFTNYKILKRLIEVFMRFLEKFEFVLGESRITKIRLDLLKFSSVLPTTMNNLLKNPKKLGLALMLSICAWLFDLSTAYLTFAGFNYFPPMEIIILVNSFGMIVQMLPFGIPGMLGVTEVLMSELYTLAGMPLELSASVILLDRFITSWMPLIVGLFVFLEYES